MHFLNGLYTPIVYWMHEHLFKICMAFVATLFFIFGGDINRAVKRVLSKYPFLFRVLAFVLLCAFGYATAAVFLAKVLNYFLAAMQPRTVVPLVTVLFLIIGILAERKSQV